MRVRALRVSSLIAAATLAGVAGRTFGQYQIVATATVPVTLPTDGSVNNVSLTYTNLVIQSYAAPSVVTVPNGNIQGAAAPYIVGTLGLSETLPGFMNFASPSVAFYLNTTTGNIQLFGQFNASSTYLYSDNAKNVSGVNIGFHTANLSGENGAGQVIGYESIEAADSTGNSTLGRHAYMYNIPANSYTSLGLTGIGTTGASYSININYSNASANVSQGTYTFSSALGIDSAGDASGTTLRYYNFAGAPQASSSAGALGTSDWFYNSTTGMTTETGLYGPGYNVVKTFTGGGIGTYASQNDKGVSNGFSVGTATVYIDTGDNNTNHTTGFDGWTFSKTTGITTAVSAYLAGITPTVDGSSLTYSYGYATSATAGTGGTLPSGTVVPGTYRATFIAALNTAGQVGFTQSLFQASSGSLSKGTDSFIYTPGSATPYQQVGLLTNGFKTGGATSFVSVAGVRSSTISYLNNAGVSVGTSTEYLSSLGGGNGSAGTTTIAWMTPAGGTSVQLGLTDAFHTNANPTLGSYINSSVSELTDTGLIGGTSARFQPGTSNSLGTDPWVYDTSKGMYFILDPNPNIPNAFTGSITYLSDGGYATGQYKIGSAASSSAFIWSEADGFTDLGTITPQLKAPPYSSASSNVQAFSNAFQAADPGANTVFANAGYVFNGATRVDGVAVLSGAVPEPASMTLLAGMAAMGCLGRRRRATV